MSSLFSDAMSAADWLSTANTLRASSSQPSQASSDARFDPPEADRLQSSLSSSWASYLSAQHGSRELATLKHQIDNQVSQINASVTALQQDLTSYKSLAAATSAESRTLQDRVRSDLDQLGHLRDGFPVLQQDVHSTREQASAAIVSLRENLEALLERLDKMNTTISGDIKAVQGQYANALKTIESLRGEIKELRAGKQLSDVKVSTLERRVEAMAGGRAEFPKDTVEFLGQLLARRGELIELLDSRSHSAAAAATARSNATATGSTLEQKTQAASNHGSRLRPMVITGSPPPAARKRKGDVPPKVPMSQAVSSSAQDLRSLLDCYKAEYKRNLPKSDAAFIWKFLDCIEDVAITRHIQESLVAILPEQVIRRRDMRNKNGRRYVYMSDTLNWREFTKALLKVPPMG